ATSEGSRGRACVSGRRPLHLGEIAPTSSLALPEGREDSLVALPIALQALPAVADPPNDGRSAAVLARPHQLRSRRARTRRPSGLHFTNATVIATRSRP